MKLEECKISMWWQEIVLSVVLLFYAVSMEL